MIERKSSFTNIHAYDLPNFSTRWSYTFTPFGCLRCRCGKISGVYYESHLYIRQKGQIVDENDTESVLQTKWHLIYIIHKPLSAQALISVKKDENIRNTVGYPSFKM